jgi:hypothetical protein
VKAIAFILSIYLLGLSGVACCTFDNCPDDKEIAIKTSPHDTGDDGGCGRCSPFFSCEGCRAMPMVVETFSFPTPVMAVPQNYADFVLPFIAEVVYDFWQPPQIA